MAIIIVQAMATLVPMASGGHPENGTSENIITESTLREFHVFHGTDGKAVKGRIKAYNPDTETVTIIKESGGARKVGLDVLSKADQACVREWHLLHGFFTKVHIHSSVRINSNGVGTEFLIWRPDKEIVYDITLENRSDYDLHDLTIDYCIHYELDRPGNRGRTTEQRAKCGTLAIGTLADGNKAQAETQPLVLPKEYPYEYYKDNELPMGKVKGIRLRIYLPLDSGKKAMREFPSPDVLMKYRKWIAPSGPLAPIN